MKSVRYCYRLQGRKFSTTPAQAVVMRPIKSNRRSPRKIVQTSFSVGSVSARTRRLRFAIIPCRTSTDNILHIANRFCDLMPRRRDHKLLPHFGEPGAAVCLIKNVEYGWHRLVWSFELICTVSVYLHLCWGPRCELVHTSTRLRFYPSLRSTPSCAHARAALPRSPNSSS